MGLHHSPFSPKLFHGISNYPERTSSPMMKMDKERISHATFLEKGKELKRTSSDAFIFPILETNCRIKIYC
jgi:hypothetical protein